MDELNQIWEKRKSALIASINKTIEDGNVDKEVLKLMRTMLETAKVKTPTMEEYFNETEDEYN